MQVVRRLKRTNCILASSEVHVTARDRGNPFRDFRILIADKKLELPLPISVSTNS